MPVSVRAGWVTVLAPSVNDAICQVVIVDDDVTHVAWTGQDPQSDIEVVVELDPRPATLERPRAG